MNDITNFEGLIIILCTVITFALGFWYGYDAGIQKMWAQFYQEQYDK